jgi:predicted ATPase
LRDLGLIHEFRVESIAEHRKEYEALVRVAPGGPEVSLTDVGFGVSQALPVVVECFYADPGSVLLFEQPEIHLHPSVQSNLADLFIEAINSREDGEDRRIQLLIESHSEHFLHRLQRRIAEGVLGKEDAALYFCSVGPRGSKLTELELDIFGNITNWPPDFFGDDMEDLVAMTEAAARRQSNGVDL